MNTWLLINISCNYYPHRIVLQYHSLSHNTNNWGQPSLRCLLPRPAAPTARKAESHLIIYLCSKDYKKQDVHPTHKIFNLCSWQSKILCLFGIISIKSQMNLKNMKRPLNTIKTARSGFAPYYRVLVHVPSGYIVSSPPWLQPHRASIGSFVRPSNW